MRSGDTLASIAEKYYGKIQYERILVEANLLDLEGGSSITRGMRLEVPALGHRRVGAGDTWESLAEELLGSAKRSDVLALANGSQPWLTPEEGAEISVPYNLRVIVRGIDTLIRAGQHNRIQFNNLSILPNAEMGDPEYQRQFGMVTVKSEIINIHGTREQLDDDVPETQDLVIATDSMDAIVIGSGLAPNASANSVWYFGSARSSASSSSSPPFQPSSVGRVPKIGTSAWSSRSTRIGLAHVSVAA